MSLTTLEKQEIALRITINFAENNTRKLPTSKDKITKLAKSCDVEVKKMASFVVEIENHRFSNKENRHNRKMARIISYFGI